MSLVDHSRPSLADEVGEPRDCPACGMPPLVRQPWGWEVYCPDCDGGDELCGRGDTYATAIEDWHSVCREYVDARYDSDDEVPGWRKPDPDVIARLYDEQMRRLRGEDVDSEADTLRPGPIVCRPLLSVVRAPRSALYAIDLTHLRAARREA